MQKRYELSETAKEAVAAGFEMAKVVLLTEGSCKYVVEVEGVENYQELSDTGILLVGRIFLTDRGLSIPTMLVPQGEWQRSDI